MFLLAADTSGKQGSIALARCGPAENCEILDVVALTGGTFSAQLIPQIAELLARHGVSKLDLEGFAVVSGPGSFTGLRVGLAAIKALADVLAKPIAAVSLLEAVAVGGTARGRISAALDAGRGEIYVGQYRVESAGTHLAWERLLTRDELGEAAAGSTIVTPDHGVAEAARAQRVPVEEIAWPRSDSIARLGWKHILRGDTVSPEALDANYIRRSDAEIFSKSGS